MVAMVVAITALGAIQLRAASERTRFIVADAYAKVQAAQAVQSGVSKQARMLTNATIEIGDSDVETALGAAAKAEAEAGAAMTALQGLINTAEGRAAFANASQAREKYTAGVKSVLSLIRGGNNTSARQTLLDDVVPPLNAYLVALDALAKLQTQGMEKAAADAAAGASLGTAVLLSLGALAAVVAVAGALLITRSVTQPIGNALRLAGAVAAGDLTTRIEVQGRDELAQLLGALSGMNDNLAKMVHEVRQSSDSIATGSTEIAMGNLDLSQRTEEQASSLQQTVASLVDLSAAVKRGAESSREATTLAEQAQHAAVQGSGVVGQVVSTMEEISRSSGRIADITGVIDGIAFQTNILALNAAVEAARAGEHGRGFAVVATEVRNLAQRAAGAAREIKSLIGESNARVESGALLVRDAGKEMEEIVARVQRVSALIGEISGGAAEQTGRIERVSEALVLQDHVTQQNSALVEQSAAAAESLKEQASVLTRLVHVFQVA
jgi:methyl-accepting chemotaxis protein